MSYRWMSIVLVALVFAGSGHPEAARRFGPDVRRAAPPARVDASGDPLPAGALWRLGSLRLNAGGPVEFLAFTPDGKNLISAGQGSSQVWDPVTGRRLEVPALADLGTGTSGHSLTGRLLFVHDARESGHLIDTKGMHVLRSWPVASSETKAHAITSDGSLFAWASDKPGVVSLVEPLGKGAPRELQWGIESIYIKMAFSADGKYLAAMEADGAVVLCLVKSGKRVRRYPGKDRNNNILRMGNQLGSALPFLGFSSDGQSLAIGTPESFSVYETDSIEQRFEFQQANTVLASTSWVVPGKTLATLHLDGTNGVVNLWDLAAGKSIRKVTIEQQAVTPLAVSPDGSRMATANERGQIQLWDGRTGKAVLPARRDESVLAASFDASGSKVVIVQRNLARRYSTRGGDPGRGVELNLHPNARIFLSPVGDRLAVHAEAVEMIDLKTGAKRVLLEEGQLPVLQFVFLPDGRHALIDQLQTEVAVIDLNTHRRRGSLTKYRRQNLGQANAMNLRLVRMGGLVQMMEANINTPIVISNDGRTLFRSTPNDVLERWEIATGKRRTSLNIAGQLLDVSPDGQVLAVGVGTVVQVIDLTNGRTTLLPDAIDSSWAVSFSPDGEWVVCAGNVERGITVWNLRTGKLAARVHGHRAILKGLNFSPTGKEFLTFSEDGTLIVWDFAEVLRRGRVVPSVTPPVRPMETLWEHLASEDAAVADKAIREVVRSPGVAERFLSRHLKPVVSIPPPVLDGLIADLNDDRAATRDRAEQSLAALGEQAGVVLQHAEKSGAPEVRLRAKRLLARTESFTRTGPEARPSRAIEALEGLGTPAARKLLTELASGADTSQTREAKSALSRLQARVSTEP